MNSSLVDSITVVTIVNIITVVAVVSLNVNYHIQTNYQVNY